MTAAELYFQFPLVCVSIVMAGAFIMAGLLAIAGAIKSCRNIE
jgi:hypothetical protein